MLAATGQPRAPRLPPSSHPRGACEAKMEPQARTWCMALGRDGVPGARARQGPERAGQRLQLEPSAPMSWSRKELTQPVAQPPGLGPQSLRAYESCPGCRQNLGAGRDQRTRALAAPRSQAPRKHHACGSHGVVPCPRDARPEFSSILSLFTLGPLNLDSLPH